MATGDLTVNSAIKDFEVPFVILLVCLGKWQGIRVPNETLFLYSFIF